MKAILIIVILSLLFFFGGYSQSVTKITSLSAEDFNKVLETKSVVLLDVRTPDEFAKEHIPGAINVDVNDSDFVSIIQNFVDQKALAIYCQSGKRSKVAALKLSEKGIEIYNLNSGLIDWEKAGFPTAGQSKQ